ncbi:MAG: hypothetical protein ACK4P4_22930 [Allorhizobium sp.]
MAKVTAIVPAEGMSGAELLRLAATVKRSSKHSMALAIVKAAGERGLQWETPSILAVLWARE